MRGPLLAWRCSTIRETRWLYVSVDGVRMLLSVSLAVYLAESQPGCLSANFSCLVASLPGCLVACLLACLFAGLSASKTARVAVYLPIRSLAVHLSICLPACLSPCLSVCLRARLHVWFLYIAVERTRCCQNHAWGGSGDVVLKETALLRKTVIASPVSPWHPYVRLPPLSQWPLLQS
eukprot:COSAG02_NODE_769_length_17369_cov_8.151013_4_plen_178_part_00